VVFDDFIHVVDTLRFLVPARRSRYRCRPGVRRGLLHHVVLQLSGDGFHRDRSMNRMSGSAQERLDVSGGRLPPGGAHSPRSWITRAATVRRRGDWVPVARQRASSRISLAFLDAVRSGKLLDARDALRTTSCASGSSRRSAG